MARNGSGTFNLVVNSWNPATNGNSATAADWQALINDIASALTQSLSADGQTALTGNLVANNNKITGLAAGTATGDSLRWQQLFSQGQPTDIASAATLDIGAVNSTLLNVTGTTTITSFGANYNGPRFLRFDGILTLTNGASLVLPGAANITTAVGDSCIAVPIGSPATGWRVAVYQKADGTAVVSQTVAAASETVAGIIEIATSAEVATGTDNTRAVTPAGLVSRAASTAATGLVELATDAEAQAGTDATRAVTPDNLGATVLGMGQTWQDVTGSRALNTSYTNTTGRSISVAVRCGVTLSQLIGLRVDGLDIQSAQGGDPGSTSASLTAVIPPNSVYSVNQLVGGPSVSNWFELR